MSAKNIAYFQEWERKLTERVTPILPDFGPEDNKAFHDSSCRLTLTKLPKLEELRKAVHDANGQKPQPDPEKVQAAKAALDAYVTNQFQPEQRTNNTTANVVLKHLDATFLNEAYDVSDLMRLVAMKQAGGPKKLADWCASRPEPQQESLDQILFHDIDTLRKFFHGGCPRDGDYGKAAWFYKNILKQMQDPNDPVLQRLAVAVALQLATPPESKVAKWSINPVQRFKHYEHAYLNGDLDPVFSQFTVWQLRFAVDCDASDDELTWGRDCIRNYRPEFCFIVDERQWRYCRIVKSDVGYSNPVWYKEPRSYDQILSGGGKCGPRAWFGRFACKAFGIPVWGCRQPGHAAMAVWTPRGWQTCLGGGFQVSFWDGLNGFNFELEAKARSKLKTDEAYYQKVYRLRMMSILKKEDNKKVDKQKMSHPSCLWYSLDLKKRQQLANQATEEDLSTLTFPKSDVETKIEKVMKTKLEVESITKEADGTIVMPGAATSKPTRDTTSESFPKSFLGGRQLFMGSKSHVEFTVPAGMASAGLYNLTMKICNVHRDDQTLKVTVNDKAQMWTAPYTMGMWEEAGPLKIEVPDGEVKIALDRSVKKGGLAIKFLKLTPA